MQRRGALWLGCCISSSKEKVLVAMSQPQLCQVTVYSSDENAPRMSECPCDWFVSHNQPRLVCLPAWATENMSFQSCLVWLFLKCLTDGWVGLLLDSLWSILSNHDLLFLLQRPWYWPPYSVWWCGNWTFFWSECPDVVLSCVSSTVGGWNCSWKSSNT